MIIKIYYDTIKRIPVVFGCSNTRIGRMAVEAAHLTQSKECIIIQQHTVVI